MYLAIEIISLPTEYLLHRRTLHISQFKKSQYTSLYKDYGLACRMINGELLLRNKEERQRLMNNDDIMIGRIKKLATDGQRYMLSHSLVAHLLVVVFGISAWIGINGIYVQLPLLVISAPEGWNLAAYIVVIIQAANVGPAVYTLARKCYPALNESLCIFALLFTGSLAMALLAFLYDNTIYIANGRHSLAMFICIFLTALVGCTSSVLFMPYLRNCSERYLVSYFIGEGLSGVVPSVVALFQGVGGNPECVDYGNGTIVEISSSPRFPPKDYFIFLLLTLLLSLCTFGFLQYLPSIRNEESSSSVDESQAKTAQTDLEQSSRDSYQSGNCDIPVQVQVFHTDSITFSRTIYLHILVGLVCFLGNGFLPGIQTYSCLPYGNVAFHLTVTLANIANPTACLFYLWFDSVNTKIIDVLSFVGMITCTYAIYLAAMSPNPPMRDSTIGVATAVIAWILLTGIIAYLKLSITSRVKQKLGPKSLFGIGAVMQSGSACGAILSFGLINYTAIFQQHKNCSPL